MMYWKKWTFLLLFSLPNIVGASEVKTDEQPQAKPQRIEAAENRSQANYCIEFYNQNSYKLAFPYCSAAAQENDMHAQFLMGEMYQQGLGVAPNYYQAFDWYQKAAEQNHPQALLVLGIAYSTGILLPIDYQKSFQYFSKAAKQKIPDAQFLLALCYQIGLGTPMNYERAQHWFSVAEQQGFTIDENLRLNIATAKLEDNALPAHDKFIKAMSLIESKEDAKQKEHVDLLSTAATANNPKAQFQLGLHYFHGTLVSQNDAKAHEWFLKASQFPYPPAQSYLAWMNALGLGIEKNMDQATALFSQAQAAYQTIIGGNSTPKSSSVVSTKAQNKEGAISNLTTQPNVKTLGEQKRSVQWYQEAAQKGDITAQTHLGTLYKDGKGVPQNFIEAYAWLNLATTNGSQGALLNRDQLAQKMTSDQIKQAQKRSVQLYQNLSARQLSQ